MASERDRTYRVGIIGTGLQGTKHAQAFAEHPAAEVVAGADTDAANLALFGERFGRTAGLYADYDEMLAHEELDIVCPILPTGVPGCRGGGGRGGRTWGVVREAYRRDSGRRRPHGRRLPRPRRQVRRR